MKSSVNSQAIVVTVVGRWLGGRQQAQKRFVLHRFALDMISLYSLYYIILFSLNSVVYGLR